MYIEEINEKIKMLQREKEKLTKGETDMKNIELNWVIRNVVSNREMDYKAKIGQLQKCNRVGIYFDAKTLNKYGFYKGDRIAVAFNGNKIFMKKDVKGLAITNAGSSLKIGISINFKNVGKVDILFDKVEKKGDILIFTEKEK